MKSLKFSSALSFALSPWWVGDLEEEGKSMPSLLLSSSLFVLDDLVVDGALGVEMGPDRILLV